MTIPNTLKELKAKTKFLKRMSFIMKTIRGRKTSKSKRGIEYNNAVKSLKKMLEIERDIEYNYNSGFNSIIRGLKQAKEHMDNNKK